MTERRLVLARALRAGAARILRDRLGATIVEYALIAALISMTTLAIYDHIGGNIKKSFDAAGKELKGG